MICLGLSATVEALRGGSKVILVDKEKNIGGNSAKASSGKLRVAVEFRHSNSH